MKDDIAAAAHAEIRKRYARPWTGKGKADRIRSVRRAQVLRVLRDRHGVTLPDDQRGRDALQLLFELGLTGPDAQLLAPWAAPEEIDRLIEDADNNWAAWFKSSDETITERVGRRLELTFGEYRGLRLTHIRPADVSRAEIEKHIDDGRSKRDRDGKRDRRATPKPPPSNDPWDLPNGRVKGLALGPLQDRKWWTVRRLTDFAREQVGGFIGLDHGAARKGVLRGVRELEDLGIVETKMEVGPRGLRELHVRRLVTAEEKEAEAQQLMHEVAMEQGGYES
jgi:hypothetical protein